MQILASQSLRKDLMMYRRIASVTTFALLATLLTSNAVLAAPKPKVKKNDPAIMTVIHAIPATFGADKVDIYSNNKLVIDNAVPGSVKSFSLEPGTQQISIYADGVLPTSDTASVLSYRPIYLPQGTDVTFVAHLSASDKPVLSLFKNMNTEPGKKRSWLIVRHVAGAPAVDVRASSKILFRSLLNGSERKVSLRFGTYPTDVVIAGTTTVAIPSANVMIKDNVNTVVYAWGSAMKGNLQFLIQEIALKKV
jgi:hypothetical protein